MSSTTYPTSLAIKRLIERTREIAPFLPANDQAPADCFPPPYLDNEQGVEMMLMVYESDRPFRLCRGVSRVSLKLAGLWLAAVLAWVFVALLIVGGVAIAYGAVLFVVAEIAKLGNVG